MNRHFPRSLFSLGLMTIAFGAHRDAHAQQRAPQTPAPGVPAPAPTPPTAQSDTLDARLSSLAARPGGLTADEVARRAATHSFDAAAQHQELLAAAAKVDQALVAYYPKLSLTARYTRLSPITLPPLGNIPANAFGMGIPKEDLNVFAFPIYLNNYLFQATLAVPVSDYLLRTSKAYESTKRSEKAAALNEQAARLKAAVDGRVSYYAWVRAQGQYAVAQAALEQSKGHLTDARHAFEVGTTSKADVLGAESHVASAELLVEQARNLVSLTEEQMRVAMGEPPGQTYVIGEDLNVDAASVADLGTLEGLRAEAMTSRPEVRALEETVGSLREQAKSVKAGYWPRLDGVADVIYANPNPRYFIPDNTFHATWDVGAQLTWSPNDAFTTSGGAAEVEARAAQTDAQKEALRNGIRVEVMQAYQALQEARVAIGTTARGLAAAEEAYRVRHELYKNGRATYVELTDSETDLTQARLAAINARADLRVAQARLVHATGRDAGKS